MKADGETGANPISRRWREYRRMTAAERRIVWRALYLLPLISLGIRLFGFGRVHARLARRPVTASPPHPLPPETARIVNGMARYVGGNCLARSLLLWWLLRRQGVESRLCIGGRKADGVFLAHAWVELDGAVLNDRPDINQTFERITAIPEVWGERPAS